MNKAVMIAIIIAVLAIGIGIAVSESNNQTIINNAQKNEKTDSKNYHLELKESVGVTGP